MNLPDVRLLQTFVIFAESDSIVAAAARLGLSQPAFSFQLKKLEDVLPHPVLTFKGKRKVLTHYGRSLYQSLKRGFDRLDLAYESANRMYASAEHVELRIGA